MRIQPDGLELLHAARVVVDVTIRPHVPDDRRDALEAVERAIMLAEDRLTREVEASAADLAVLTDARAKMRGTILESLPEPRRYDARLVAKAISVASLRLANGPLAERLEYERLAELLDAPFVADASLHEIRCALLLLNQQLVNRIRAAKADLGMPQYRATLAYLEATTNEALSESNPTYRRRGSAPGRSSLEISTVTAVMGLPAEEIAPAPGAEPKSLTTADQIGMPQAPFACIDGWLQLCGVVGEAVCAPSKAALSAQADFLGWFTQRLAANPHVPMAAVEGAHQAHDFSVAMVDANAVFLKLALAPFRRGEPRSADATGSR